MLELERFCYGPQGVFGRLRMEEHEWFTVERRWFNNRPYESCIPEGQYRLIRTTYYRRGYQTFEVSPVPNRDRILIHVANRPKEVLGCIGIGLELGVVDHQWAVLDSQAAFEEFMEAMKHTQEGIIAITHRKGEGINDTTIAPC